MKLNIDAKHVVLLLLSTFLGAWLSSLQGDAGLFVDLQHWKTAEPDLIAAGAAGFLSVANQARKSFIEFVTPPPAIGGAVLTTQLPTLPPPAAVPSNLKFTALAGLVALFVLGCGVALPAVIADVSTIATDIVQDVNAHMAPEAIVLDVLAKTGAQDESTILSVLESMLGDPQLAAKNPELVAPLQAVHTVAAAKMAARPHASLVLPAIRASVVATLACFKTEPYCTVLR